MKEIELLMKEGQMLREVIRNKNREIKDLRIVQFEGRINNWLQEQQLVDTDSVSSEDQDSDYSTKGTNMTSSREDLVELDPENQGNFRQRSGTEKSSPTELFQDQLSGLRDKDHFLKNQEAVCIQYTLPSSRSISMDMAKLLEEEDQCTDVILTYNYAHKSTTIPSASIPRCTIAGLMSFDGTSCVEFLIVTEGLQVLPFTE